MAQAKADWYGSIETAKQIEISLRQLYHWVNDLHVVEPKVERHGLREFRRFSPGDIEKLIRMRDLVRWGYNLQAAAGFVRGFVRPIIKEHRGQEDDNND